MRERERERERERDVCLAKDSEATLQEKLAFSLLEKLDSKRIVSTVRREDND